MFKSVAVLVAATQATNLLSLAVAPADVITTDTTTAGVVVPSDSTTDATAGTVVPSDSTTDATAGTDATGTDVTPVKPASDGTDVVPVDPVVPDVDPVKPDVDPVNPDVDPVKPDVDPVKPDTPLPIEPTDDEFSPMQTITVADIKKFGVWKKQIFELARQKYRHFVPVTYAKLSKKGIVQNYKVVFDVGHESDDEEHLTVVVDVSPLPDGKIRPRIESVLTPDGVMHDAKEIHDGDHDHHDHGKKWKKEIQKNLKKRFEDFRHRIEEFAKKIAGKENYKGKFDPVQFKIDTDTTTGSITYTIQYEIDDGKLVQATVYVPPLVKDSDGAAAAVQPDPQVTQFISDDGDVTGAMQLKTGFMMMATLVATVMLS